MALGTVELMPEGVSQHLRMGTKKNKEGRETEEKGKQKRVNTEKVKLSWIKSPKSQTNSSCLATAE